MPDETVIDGEVFALDEQGKPNFNLLQNYRSAESHIMLYAFDVLVRRGELLMKQPLSKRREVLESTVKPHAHVGNSQGSLLRPVEQDNSKAFAIMAVPDQWPLAFCATIVTHLKALRI